MNFKTVGREFWICGIVCDCRWHDPLADRTLRIKQNDNDNDNDNERELIQRVVINKSRTR